MDKKFIKIKKLLLLCNGIIAGSVLYLWIFAYPHDIRIGVLLCGCFISAYLSIQDSKTTAKLLIGFKDDFMRLAKSQNELHEALRDHEEYVDRVSDEIEKLKDFGDDREKQLHQLQVFATAIKELHKDKKN